MRTGRVGICGAALRIRHKTPAFAFGRGGYEGILKADIEVKVWSEKYPA